MRTSLASIILLAVLIWSGPSALAQDTRYVGAPARVDMDFHPAVAPNAYTGGLKPSATCVSSSGQIYVLSTEPPPAPSGNIRVSRLLPDGSLDPAFQSSTLVPHDPRPFATRDGGLLIFGNEGKWRLQADGTSDPQWQPSEDWRDRQGLRVLAELPDGRLVVGADDQILFLNPTGTLASTSVIEMGGIVEGVTILPDDQILLHYFQQTQLGPKGRIQRLSASGVRDLTHVPPPAEWSIHGIALTQGGMLLWAKNSEGGDHLLGAKDNGDFDPTYLPRAGIDYPVEALLSDAKGYWLVQRTDLDPNGMLVRFTRLNGAGNPVHQTTRELPDGPIWSETGSLWLSYEVMRRHQADTGVLNYHLLSDGSLLIEGPVVANGHLSRHFVRMDVHAGTPRLEVSPASARIAENSGRTDVRLHRAGDRSAALTVQWATEDRTALAGVDYQAASGELTFPAGESTTTIRVTMLDNAALDEDRSVRLRFTTVPDGVALPPVQITLANDDLGFSPASLRVFPGGVWTARVTGHLTRNGWPGPGTGTFVEASTNLFRTTLYDAWLPPWFSEVSSGFGDSFGEVSQLFLRLRPSE